MQVDPVVTPWDEPPHPFSLPPDLTPQKFVEAGNEGRLIRDLRGRAKFKNPTLVLAHAAAEFFKAQRAQTATARQEAIDLGTAIADLAVTGRQAYGHFKNGINMLSLEGTLRQRLAAQRPPVPAIDTEIQAAMDQALDRAYGVAWALRGRLRSARHCARRLDGSRSPPKTTCLTARSTCQHRSSSSTRSR